MCCYYIEVPILLSYVNDVGKRFYSNYKILVYSLQNISLNPSKISSILLNTNSDEKIKIVVENLPKSSVVPLIKYIHSTASCDFNE